MNVIKEMAKITGLTEEQVATIHAISMNIERMLSGIQGNTKKFGSPDIFKQFIHNIPDRSNPMICFLIGYYCGVINMKLLGQEIVRIITEDQHKMN